MADLARLFNFLSETGTPISSSQVDQELNQIIARLNDVDADSLIAALATQLGISQAGNPRRGHFEQAAAGTRTNVAYGALTNGPDVVSGVVVPSNAIVRLYYQATWQESVANAANAALFIGANQLQTIITASDSVGPTAQAAAMGVAAKDQPLLMTPIGLVSTRAATTGYTSDPTTGVAQSVFASGTGPDNVIEVATSTAITGPAGLGGGVLIDNLAAGTYDFSVQFKASSGTVTVKNRRLRVVVESF